MSALAVLSVRRVEAVELEAAGNIAAGEKVELEVTANPEVETNAVELRLSFDNATVKNFQSAENFLSLGVCDSDNNEYLDDKVCVDLASPEKIEAGDSLGTVTIEGVSTGVYLVEDNSTYVDETADAGSDDTVENDTVSQDSQTQTEEVSEEDFQDEKYLVLRILATIFVLVLLALVAVGNRSGDLPDLGGVVI
ncbi:hypothetical protein GF389_05655 [Candidatus Dojkabacteria bacterium]|nr:hypothetical protein [Candidatus Dojkabacteria bacterium]